MRGEPAFGGFELRSRISCLRKPVKPREFVVPFIAEGCRQKLFCFVHRALSHEVPGIDGDEVWMMTQAMGYGAPSLFQYTGGATGQGKHEQFAPRLKFEGVDVGCRQRLVLAQLLNNIGQAFPVVQFTVSLCQQTENPRMFRFHSAQLGKRCECAFILVCQDLQLRLSHPGGQSMPRHAAMGEGQILVAILRVALRLGNECGSKVVDRRRLAMSDVGK